MNPARITSTRKNISSQSSCLHLRRRCCGGAADHLGSYWNVALHTAMCNNLHMATNLALDDKLIEEARKAGGHRTKKDAVTAALAEYVKRHKQQRILDAFGSFDFDPAYDYKSERRRSR
jgi:Arc/MetJ family transcription regulator